MGDELLAKCDAAILKFEDAVPNQDSDVVITAFLEDLKQAARERKREIVEHYIGMNTVFSSRQVCCPHETRDPRAVLGKSPINR